MKKSILFLTVSLFLGIVAHAQSEYMEAPSDKAASLTKADSNKGKTLELIAIFNDAIDAPTKYNEYVTPYLKDASFPKKTKNTSKKDYDTQLESWINNNPKKIEKLLADRQEAHIKLYGPRKK